MSRTDLRKYMTFKVLKHLKPILEMKTSTKPNFNLCMEERLLTNMSQPLIRTRRYMGPAGTKRLSIDFA